ncbi:MAG: HAD family hydrolase [Bacillota bacterium]|nr:HAD family hydrolase [Candidatus Fermentithermobacillaceae bacterium]
MSRTALFDLDGTLLPVETDFFLKHYMDALAECFKGVMSTEAFQKALLEATYETINNLDPSTGNFEAFAASFTRLSGLPWDGVWPIFERYYVERYPKLRVHVPENPSAQAAVTKCVENGWRIVLATQPLFPEIATRERMKWCHIDSLPWEMVTTLDNMHFCKPHTEYYREIIEMLRLDASRCVMIGNDMQEDMVAKKVGMKTFLVEDLLIDRGEDLKPDSRGRLVDVPQVLNDLLPA